MIVGSFYLGSKFGGKVMGDYSSNHQYSHQLLPEEITDEEIKKLNEEIKLNQYQFHQILESSKTLSATIKFYSDENELVVKNKKQQKKKKEFLDKKPKEDDSTKGLVIAKKSDEKKDSKVAVDKKADQKNLEDRKKPKPKKKVEEVSIKEKEESDPLADLLKKDLNSNYTLILKSTSSKNTADRSYQRFKKDGYSVRVEEVLSDNDEIIYQVRVGKYPSKEAAIIGQKRFKKLYLINPAITTY